VTVSRRKATLSFGQGDSFRRKVTVFAPKATVWAVLAEHRVTSVTSTDPVLVIGSAWPPVERS